MAKREEFDPNEILDEVSGTADTDFDILGDLPELDNSNHDEELDDLFSDDFLTILGLEPKAKEEAPAEVIPEPVEEEVPEAPAPEDEDVKEYVASPVPAFDVEPELD